MELFVSTALIIQLAMAKGKILHRKKFNKIKHLTISSNWGIIYIGL